MAVPIAYTWDEPQRKFRNQFGRFVSRKEVRKSLDRYVDKLQDEAGRLTQSLMDQNIDIGTWQRGMERMIKRGHTAATMIAKGGREQVKSRDWGRAGRTIRDQYRYLARFAEQLEAGRPMDGRTINRAKMYAIAPTATYENLLRDDDIRAGFDVERRVLHSVNPCKPCVRYADMGWQPAGKLPGIGQKCKCLSRCRCTFERYRSSVPRNRFGILRWQLHSIGSRIIRRAIIGGGGRRSAMESNRPRSIYSAPPRSDPPRSIAS